MIVRLFFALLFFCLFARSSFSQLVDTTFVISTEDEGFGRAVALEGDHLAIGTASESVYLYYWDGIAWIESSQLMASDGKAGDGFGTTIFMYGDLLAVGAPGHDTAFEDAGAVYLFTFDAGEWVEEAKLVASDTQRKGLFGYSISMDSNFVFVGAPATNSGTNGGAYLFEKTGQGEWLETNKMAPGSTSGVIGIGGMVAIDKDRLAISGYTIDDTIFLPEARIYVFDLIGNVWTSTSILDAGNGYGPRVLEFSEDFLVYGIQGYPASDGVPGHCGIYKRAETGWGERVTLSAAEFGANSFCTAAEIEKDRLIVGSPKERFIDETLISSAYIYKLSDGEWIEKDTLQTPEEFVIPYIDFGASVALQGEWRVIGAPGDDYRFVGNGQVFIHRISEELGSTAEESPVELSSELALFQNFPNPFNSSTEIVYELTALSQVRLEAYDLLGRKVDTIIDGIQPGGKYSVTWVPEGIAQGIYLYRLQADKEIITFKMTYVK